jgi:hypothetical protein
MQYPTSDIPQANRLDLVIEVVIARSQPELDTREIIEIIRSKTQKEYAPRQANYYADAAVSFGLLQKTESGYLRTRLGELLKSKSAIGEGDGVFRQALMNTPLIADLVGDLNRDYGGNVSLENVSTWLQEHTDLAPATAVRRSSNILRCLEFLQNKES